ncbi:hypothetical protein HCJ39_07210 [Listeria rocourtiae]|uniref:hypothetical protein n=1 Tax=Listeria rocourtiae TaxID=647910 RepID=UPI001629C8F9|nr:hypothetical protein [Listeria rocourtiae]MBC1604499.1 hypothetical protein [Listeria rocourtiae]
MTWMQRIIKTNERNFKHKLIESSEEGLIFQTGNYRIRVDAYTKFVSYYHVNHKEMCAVYPSFDKEEAVSRAISLLAKGVNKNDFITDEEVEVINQFGYVAVYDMNYYYPVFFREADFKAYLGVSDKMTIQQINDWVEEKMDIYSLTDVMERYDVIVGRRAILNEVNRGVGNEQPLLTLTRNQKHYNGILYKDFNRLEPPIYLHNFIFRGVPNHMRVT